MSRPNNAPPSRSIQAEKQPRSKGDHDPRRGSHEFNEGRGPIILLEGRQKDIVTQRILEEQEIDSQEKAKIKELEEKNGWKFTSDTAGKMFLRIQEKDTNRFVECNDFARDCKKAIRADPRADSKKRGTTVSSGNTLLTPDKKEKHFKRLIALLSSKNKYAQYWTIGDLPDEWFKIDNTVLCSKEEQATLVKEVEKRKKILEKSKIGKVEFDGKSKDDNVARKRHGSQ